MSGDIGAPLRISMTDQEPIGWFFDNCFKPLFSHAEILQIAGDDRVTHDTLQNWANRKYVEPKLVNGKRRYSPIQAAQVVLAQPLLYLLSMEPRYATIVLLEGLLGLRRGLNLKKFTWSEAKYQALAYRTDLARRDSSELI